MTDDEDIDGLAAEYVLGSLSLGERKDVDARRRTDRALREAVEAWERRLGPLSDRVPEVAPPPHLLAAVMRRLSSPAARSFGPAEVIILRRSAARWRALAVTATGLAACLALVFGWFFYLPPVPATLVAELYRASGGPTADEMMKPAFAVSVDLKDCKISIRPVTAQPRPGRSYQLWAIRRGETAPSSLGVIAPSQASTVPCPADRPPSDLVNAMLAVSLEAEGGSASGTPTGSFLFVGKLVPTQARSAGETPR